MVTSYIGADVDSKMTELAVEQRGDIVERIRVFTGIASIREVLGSIGGRKVMAVEEGPLAHWLWRNLRNDVDRLIICDPRRNAYIAKDGDKDDPIDAGKLAELLRGGFVREVYHSDDEQRVQLKRWVGYYHDRVRQAVREINKLRGHCRHYGVRPPRAALLNPTVRQEWFSRLDEPDLAALLAVAWPGFDAVRQQVQACRREISRCCRSYEIVAAWQALPGIGLIRAATLLAYLDTPWRFKTKEKLAKYCGVGLIRSASGTDRHGRPKTGRLQLAWQVNGHLKNAVMGATKSAIAQGANVFADRYQACLQKGMSMTNARHTVARKILSVMWGMWKSGRPFEPECV